MSITIPDGLAKRLRKYRLSIKPRLAIARIFREALQGYLPTGVVSKRKFDVTPALRGSGFTDVSKNHDLWIAALNRD